MESLNGHIQELRREWESLVNSKATQDTLKLFIDLGTTIIKLIKSVGGLGTALIQLGTIWTMLKLSKWGKTFGDIMSSVSSLSGVMNKATTAFNLAGGGIKGFSAALASSKSAMALATGGLSLLIAALGFIINKFQEAKQKHDEWVETTLDAANTNKKNLQSLIENINKYKELASKIDKTEDEEAEFQTIESEIVSILGDKAEALSKLKEGTEEYTAAVEKLTEAEIANLTAQLYTTQNAAEDKLKSLVSPRMGEKVLTPSRQGLYGKDAGYNVLSSSGMTTMRGQNLLYLKDTYDSGQAFREGKITEVQHSINVYKNYSDALKILNDEILKLNDNGQKEEAAAISKSQSYQNITERVNELKEAYTSWIEAELAQIELSTSGTNRIIDTAEEYNSLTDSIINNNKYTETQKDILLELAESAYPQFSKSIEESSEEIKNNSFEMTQLSETTKDELTSLKELETAYSTLSSALDEYNQNGGLSAKTIDTLITEYSDYLQYLVDENGNLNLNKEAIDAVVNAKKEDIKATIIQEALNRIDSLKAQTEEERNLAQEIENQTQKIKENNQARFESLALLPMEDLGANAEEIKNIIDDAQRRIALLNQLFISGGSGSGGSSAAKKTTDVWKEAFTKAYNDLKNRRDRDLIDNEQYYKELGELNDKYFKDRVEYAEEYAKYELELYKGLQTLFKEYIDDLNHEYTMLENQGADKNTLIDKYKEIQEELHRQAEYYRSLNLEGNKELIDDLSEQWWKYQKNIDKLSQEIEEERKKQVEERFSNLRDVALEIIESQIKEKQAALEEQNALLDEQIDKYKEEEDTLGDQKDIEEKLLKIEEARKKLAEAKNQKVRIYREGQGFVYETDFDAVYSAQKELDSLLEDWNLFQEKARISDIVAQLENEKQANKDRVNQEIADLNKLKDAWDKSLDMAKNVEDYQGWLTKIKNTENQSFQERLKSVQEFVNAYNREMNSLQTNVPSDTSTQSGSLGTSSGRLTKKYNGVEYDPNFDYQQRINEAEASGAPTDYLVSLEQKRNAKIMGEGLTGQQTTYKYTYDDGSSSSKSSKSSSSESSSQPAHSSAGKSSSSGGTLLNKAVNFIKSITGLASGTEHADGMPHFVGEDGPELYVPPRGSSIIPNDLTSNLMAWGNINPMQLVGAMSGGGNTTIEVSNITLPNVTDAHSFVEELKNFKGFAVQKQSYRV